MRFRPSIRRAGLLVLALLPLASCFDSSAGHGGRLQGVATASPAESSQVWSEVADFRLVRQDGVEVGLEDLAGRPWVLACSFTRCIGPCERISTSMQVLQDELADTDVLLVSVSVDPTNDSPERLRTYGGRFDADPERWWFLTGEESEVYKLITGSFKLAVDAADEGRPHLITHDSRLSAVDREGKVRGWYHHEDDRDLLVERMRYLAGE